MDIKIKLGDYIGRSAWPFISIGGSYDFGIRYRQKVGTFKIFKDIWKYPKTVNKDINNLNSRGFELRAGFGYDIRFVGYIVSYSLVYRHKLYNLFNKDYIDENGNMPYENYETSWGTVGFVVSTKIPRWAR